MLVSAKRITVVNLISRHPGARTKTLKPRQRLRLQSFAEFEVGLAARHLRQELANQGADGGSLLGGHHAGTMVNVIGKTDCDILHSLTVTLSLERTTADWRARKPLSSDQLADSISVQRFWCRGLTVTSGDHY